VEIIPDGRLTFCLEGKRLRGEFALVRFTGKRKDWLLLKKRDTDADPHGDRTGFDSFAARSFAENDCAPRDLLAAISEGCQRGLGSVWTDTAIHVARNVLKRRKP